MIKLRSGIYKITCKITGIFYIGSASYLTKRIGNHFDAMKEGTHFNPKVQNAVNKYGIENFIWEVVEYCEKDKLIEREQYYLDTLLFAQEFIRKEDKRFSQLGFNISPLAGSPRGCKRSEETKAKLRAIKLLQGPIPLRSWTEEDKDVSRQRMIKLHKEKKIPPRKYTKEQRLEKSKITKEYFKNLETNFRWKQVMQLDLENNPIKEWLSATHAAKELNLCNKNISAVCIGKRKTYKNFKWKFKDV